jgi:hypothetical protein
MSGRRLATSIALAMGIASALSVRLSHPEMHTDEITYMSCVVESMAQGTVFPVKGDGAVFLKKPPLSLWLTRLSFELMGPSPFAARLPSVLAAAMTAVVLYLFGAAAIGEGAGVLAALIFAFTPGLLVLHGIRSATPDALEILLVTSAVVSLELWRRRRRPWTLTCVVICSAVSAWVKSPFALVVLMAYLFATELPAHRAGLGTPRLGLTVACVAGAWLGAYLIWLGTLSTATSPRVVVRQLLLVQYVQRMQGRLDLAHVQGPSYLLESTFRDFGPLLLLPAGAVAARWFASRKGKQPWSYDATCLAVWSLAAPLLASASLSKLPWYAYLSYPGMALFLAMSAHSLAGAVSGRRAVQTAFLAACAALLGGRVPAGAVWPAEAQYRGLTGDLWEIASRNPDVVLVPGPGFRLSRHYGEAGREASLLIRMLFQRQSGSSSPGSCRAILVNRADLSTRQDAIELRPPMRRRPGLVLIDGCNGWLREELTITSFRRHRQLALGAAAPSFRNGVRILGPGQIGPIHDPTRRRRNPARAQGNALGIRATETRIRGPERAAQPILHVGPVRLLGRWEARSCRSTASRSSTSPPATGPETSACSARCPAAKAARAATSTSS